MKQKHYAPNINKLNDKTKKTFKVRTVSSVMIALFILVSFACSALSDTKWGWSGNVSNATNQVFTYIQMVLMLVVISFAAIEITRLHFYKNYFVLITVLLSLMTISFVPTFIYIGDTFNYFSMDANALFFWYFITIILCLVVVSIVNFIILWWQGINDIKKIFIHLLIIGLASLFANSWLFFSFNKGWTTLLILYAITAGTDVFAYIGGMLFGKQKMSPHISPNKTIGGGIIGVIGSMLVSIIFLVTLSLIPGPFNILGNFFGVMFADGAGATSGTENIFFNSPSWWVTVVFLLLILGVIAITGDLSYSFIKRSYGVKDFSNLIPGHGGMLDRIDSLTFVVPSFFIFTALIAMFSTTSNFF
ncbi:MAG: phosphatidate cytidylyltransferase [Mycoplasma sp.]